MRPLFISLVIPVLFASFAAAASTPTRFAYGTQIEVRGQTVDAVLVRLEAALKVEGFGILTTMNVAQKMKKKLGVTMRPYVVLGVCNPKLAWQALQKQPHIGLMLPCKMVVQQSPGGDGVLVSIGDPVALFRMTGDPTLGPLAKEVHARLLRVLKAAAGQAKLPK